MKKTNRIKKARLEGKKLQRLSRAELAFVVGGNGNADPAFYRNGGWGNVGNNGGYNGSGNNDGGLHQNTGR
jgi:hypothetical protein